MSLNEISDRCVRCSRNRWLVKVSANSSFGVPSICPSFTLQLSLNSHSIESGTDGKSIGTTGTVSAGSGVVVEFSTGAQAPGECVSNLNEVCGSECTVDSADRLVLLSDIESLSPHRALSLCSACVSLRVLGFTLM